MQKEILKSRRGDYTMTDVQPNPLVWTPVPMGTNKRDNGVTSEIEYARMNKLKYHKYWEGEPEEFVNSYQSFYNEMFDLAWLHNKEDRHNIVVCKDCCLTLVQYHNGTLFAYSRSTDMKNGYWSDKRVLDYLAEHINKRRPSCKVEKIVWYLAIPHKYEKEGLARLI